MVPRELVPRGAERPERLDRVATWRPKTGLTIPDLGLCCGADDGNRTRIFSLGS